MQHPGCYSHIFLFFKNGKNIDGYCQILISWHVPLIFPYYVVTLLHSGGSSYISPIKLSHMFIVKQLNYIFHVISVFLKKIELVVLGMPHLYIHILKLMKSNNGSCLNFKNGRVLWSFFWHSCLSHSLNYHTYLF